MCPFAIRIWAHVSFHRFHALTRAQLGSMAAQLERGDRKARRPRERTGSCALVGLWGRVIPKPAARA